MRKASILAAALACCAGTMMMTREAHALGPVDLEIGAKAGVGTNPISSSGSFSAPNPLGFGLGARAGVDFLGFYGGVQLMYYFGSSQSASVPGESGSVSFHTFMYGVEAGYGFSVSVLTIRPQLGIGNLTLSESGSVQGVVNADVASGSNSNLYLEPGVTGLISLGGWFVGADANLLFLPGASYDTTTAFTLHGQIGIKL